MILTGETEVLGEKHYTVWVVDERMSMEQWWNDTDRGKLKCWGKNIIQMTVLGKPLSQYHFVHHKFHPDLSGVEPELLR